MFAFFKKKKTKTLADLSVAEIKDQRQKLDYEERRIISDLDKLSDKRSAELKQFAIAKANNDKSKKQLLTRKLEEIDAKIGSLHMQHNHLSKSMRVSNGLDLVKQNEEMLRRISGNLVEMDINALSEYIQEATHKGELEVEQLDELVLSIDQFSPKEDLRLDEKMSKYETEVETLAINESIDHSTNEIVAEVDPVAEYEKEVEDIKLQAQTLS